MNWTIIQPSQLPDPGGEPMPGAARVGSIKFIGPEAGLSEDQKRALVAGLENALRTRFATVAE